MEDPPPLPSPPIAAAPPPDPAPASETHHYHYRPHARTRAILEGALRPVRVIDQYPRGTRAARFNAMLGVKITNAVGTMACAYIFTVIALVSLPSAIKSGSVIVIISWIAQTFLQLVLLSIIMVGQNVQAQAADLRSENTYKDAEAVLHESLQIQQHLENQDALLSQLLSQVDALTKRIEAPH
jgi:hypothetical protein